MESSISIYILRREQLDQVRHFLIEQICLHFEFNQETYPLPDLDDHNLSYQKSVEGFWMAMGGDRIVGTIGMMALNCKAAEIRRFFVHTDYHNYGIGYGLFKNLKKKALDAGFKYFVLGIAERLDQAARFYRRQGFYEISRKALPVEFVQSPEDKKFLQLELG